MNRSRLGFWGHKGSSYGEPHVAGVLEASVRALSGVVSLAKQALALLRSQWVKSINILNDEFLFGGGLLCVLDILL